MGIDNNNNLHEVAISGVEHIFNWCLYEYLKNYEIKIKDQVKEKIVAYLVKPKLPHVFDCGEHPTYIEWNLFKQRDKKTFPPTKDNTNFIVNGLVTNGDDAEYMNIKAHACIVVNKYEPYKSKQALYFKSKFYEFEFRKDNNCVADIKGEIDDVLLWLPLLKIKQYVIYEVFDKF